MIPEKADLKKILLAVKTNSSYDLSNYSTNSMMRRFVKILTDSKLNVEELIDKINTDPVFSEELIKKITVNTTELFRDPKIWINLRENILPLFEGRDEIRVWHPGCSTGQEVYSMMILLDSMNLLEKSQIFASDINEDVLDVAKAGEYKYRFNKESLKNFSTSFQLEEKDVKEEIKKYFSINELQDILKMKDFLVEKPVYKKIDLVQDDNLFEEKFDLIICRNVIIYFNYELQNKVLNLFYNNMTEKSCLVLGLHESIIGPYSSKFLKKKTVYFKN